MMNKIFIIIAIIFVFSGCSPSTSKYKAEDDYYLQSNIFWERYFYGNIEDAQIAIKSLESELSRVEDTLYPKFPIKQEKLLISLRAMDLYCFISQEKLCQHYINISRVLVEQGIESVPIKGTVDSGVLFQILAEMNGSLIPIWKSEPNAP